MLLAILAASFLLVFRSVSDTPGWGKVLRPMYTKLLIVVSSTLFSPRRLISPPLLYIGKQGTHEAVT